MRALFGLVLATAALTMIGCGGPGGAGGDAGAGTDANLADTGSVDAGTADAPTPDAGIDAATADLVLTVVIAGTAPGSVTSAPAGIDCGTECAASFPSGTVVTLTATPDVGSSFAGWNGGGCTGTTPTCAVVVDEALAVTASFEPAIHRLTVTVMGDGAGSVSSTPSGIACPGTCTIDVPHGTSVSLSALADVGSTFAGWAGECSGTLDCMVVVDADMTVSAGFALDQTLMVAVLGTGSGRVSSSPAGIDCGIDCDETYARGTMVTLTATPDATSTFAGWSGACSGTGACTVTMDAAQMVGASFDLILYDLSVVPAGAGTGTITSAPAGISCGTTCTAPFAAGTVVVLTAAPAASSTFAGWSGGGCSGTGTCTVTMTAATAVTATFDATVFSTTSGWMCAGGVACQDVYDFTFAAGTDVTIAVTSITGASVLRLGAFAPGVALTGANLLTGPTSDRMCGGQNVSDSVTFRAVTAGTYRIAVGRDWGSSAGSTGSYALTVTTSAPIFPLGQTADDVASGATATRCGFIFTASSGWTCGSGVSCQDVYDFTTLASTTATIAVSAVTGASVLRLAAFDGAAVTTTNRLNGGLTDRRCVGQNVSDMATTGALALGQHRFAVGRDWGSSAGASGTYTVTITTPNVPLVVLGQTSNDTSSALPTTSCP